MKVEMQETDRVLRIIAEAIDEALNHGHGPKKIGFVLLIAPFDGPLGARTNYISNGKRPDMMAMLKEVTARLDGQPEISGRA